MTACSCVWCGVRLSVCLSLSVLSVCPSVSVGTTALTCWRSVLQCCLMGTCPHTPTPTTTRSRRWRSEWTCPAPRGPTTWTRRGAAVAAAAAVGMTCTPWTAAVTPSERRVRVWPARASRRSCVGYAATGRPAITTTPSAARAAKVRFEPRHAWKTACSRQCGEFLFFSFYIFIYFFLLNSFPRSPVTMWNAFVTCVYRVTLSVFSWGTVQQQHQQQRTSLGIRQDSFIARLKSTTTSATANLFTYKTIYFIPLLKFTTTTATTKLFM